MEMIFWILILLNIIMGLSLIMHKKVNKSESVILIGLPMLLILVYYYFNLDLYMKTGLISIFQELQKGNQNVYITLLLLINLFLLTLVNIGKVMTGD